MTEREGRQIPEPTDALLLAIDRLQVAVARLAQHAPDADRTAFDAALGQLLVVVFDRVSSMAATPTVLLSPRLERLEQSHARTVETVVHHLAAAVQVQALTARMDELEMRLKALER